MKKNDKMIYSCKNLFLFTFLTAILLSSLTTYSFAGAKLPLPRFVSLRSNDIIMRAGPGREYPIKWRLHKKGLPLKITAEYDTWRCVECHDGTKGWIHQSLLSGKRTLLVRDTPKLLLSSHNRTAHPRAKLAPGLILPTKLKKCTVDRCPVTVKGIDGWVNKRDVWGLLADE